MDKFCEHCGSPLPQGSKTCPNCSGSTNNSGVQPYNNPQQNSNQYTNPQYNQPANNAYNAEPMVHPEEHVTVGGWIGRMLIPYIPFVGPIVYMIMLFVWAFGSERRLSLKNFAKAQLILSLIFTGIAIILIIVVFCIFMSVADRIDYYKLEQFFRLLS